VATPIGNLRDIGLRALDVLKDVDAIAAEDTRVTARLLDRHGISKRLIPVHEHNERRAVGEILGLLAAGKSLALTTDAGTPALSAAGLPWDHFLFYGFLPQRAAERRRALAALEAAPYAIVFYEAPHRILDCLADLRAALGGGRRIVIARELTKIHESMHECTLAEAGDWVAQDPDRARGEFVLIVEGAAPRRPGPEDADRTLEILLDALPVSQAVSLATKLTGGRRNELYKRALALRKR
jgi:16S rRNA (cytidine1402-2'-O)-methyltransferase